MLHRSCKVYKKDEPLDEKGFQQVLKGGDGAAMEVFIRHMVRVKNCISLF